MLLVALHELGGQFRVLEIVAILLKLDPVERRLVAGRRQVVSHSSG